MSADFFNTIPLDFFMPNKKQGISSLYHLLRRAKKHSKHVKITRPKAKHFSLPKKTDSKYFPAELQNYIVLHTKSQQSIHFKIGERTVTIHFIHMKKNNNFDINKYVDSLALLFSLMDLVTHNKSVNKHLRVEVYLTPFKKTMPGMSEEFLPMHVNSALTYVCESNGEIIIYREEEWFKVLIHECIHSYCLDFSQHDQKLLGRCIVNYFPIHVENILLSETYAETWAEILNCALLSFNDAAHSLRLFSLYFNFYMQVEIVHSIFQSNKILERYHSSFSSLREKKFLWKQKTHVYEYHVLKTILLFSFDKFIVWCQESNGSDLIPYRGNSYLFCDLIMESYQDKDFQEKVRRIKNRSNGDGLRMSINEL